MKFFIDDRVIVLSDRGMNEQEFFDFCMTNRDLILERDKNGNILIMPPVNINSANWELRAGGALDAWNLKTGLGYVYSSQVGLTLPNGAIRSPDASWIAKEKIDVLPQSERETFAHICPDFVIEIRSKSDKLKPLQEKMEEFMECGCQLGFLIDPYDKKAWIYQDKTINEHNDFTGFLSGGNILPGFELSLTMFV